MHRTRLRSPVCGWQARPGCGHRRDHRARAFHALEAAFATPPRESLKARHCQAARAQRRARVVPRPRHDPSAVARGEGKDCLAKAPRCQQIARSAASKSENDSMTPVVMTPVVAVIAPGMMGAAVGKRLTDHGLKVLTSLQGRSAETRERAQAAGMVAASDEGIAATDFILSILPPGDALALAHRFPVPPTARNTKPVYVDCNAVSPPTVDRSAAAIAPTGSAFVDAGIIGAPPKPPDAGPRFYASGPDAPRFAALKDFGLDIRVLGGPMSTASALKMSYAGITNGLQALAAAVLP